MNTFHTTISAILLLSTLLVCAKPPHRDLTGGIQRISTAETDIAKLKCSHLIGPNDRLQLQHRPRSDLKNSDTDDNKFWGKHTESVLNLILTVMDCKDVPGLSIAVVKNDDVWARGFGVGDVVTQRPVESGTLFGIGSLSKSFMATLLAMALEKYNLGDKKLSWKTKVKDILGEDFRLTEGLEEKVTLEDILTHRTGLYSVDIMALAGFPADMTRSQFIRNLRHLPRLLPFRFTMYYNNWMYSLASDVTEKLLGGSWKTLLKSNLLWPIGMEGARVVWDDVNVTSYDMAQPYQKIRGDLVEVDESLFDLRQGKSTGSLAVSADDMARWMTFLLRQGVTPDGTRVVSSSMMQDIMTSHVGLVQTTVDKEVREKENGYGFGFYTGLYRGEKTLTHGGEWFGYRSFIQLFPDKDVGVFISTNGPGTTQAINAYRAIAHYIQDILLGYRPSLNVTSACHFGVNSGGPEVDLEAGNVDNVCEENGDYYANHISPSGSGGSGFIKDVSRYLGTYSHPLYGDVTVTRSDRYCGLVFGFQRLRGFLIPTDNPFTFQVQFNGITEFYSWDNFVSQRGQLFFGKHNLSRDGKCTTLVLEAPAFFQMERLEFSTQQKRGMNGKDILT